MPFFMQLTYEAGPFFTGKRTSITAATTHYSTFESEEELNPSGSRGVLRIYLDFFHMLD